MVADRLSAATLAALPPGVAAPAYDRSSLSVGIVHLGAGGFHRSHQAMFLDRLMNLGLARDWGICAVGTMPGDRRLADALTEQDCLYTLAVKNADGSREYRVIGSILEYLLAPDDPAAVISRMADPAVRIVSMTITEGGYFTDDVTGEFDPEHPAIRRDASQSDAPATVFGLITAALRLRRERGVAPFTVMSCDNIQGNGEAARNAVVGFARLVDEGLAGWIASEVSFPSSMVDRITPVTLDADRHEVSEAIGLVDQCPVVCEPFAQWVLEDAFPLGRPPYEDAGVQLVSDVEPYELMKLRLLNATHQGLCYFGYLAGYRYAHEAASDEDLAAFLLRYMDEEATPTLRPVPGIDLPTYKRTLIERYRNPGIRDTLARLCAESSDRIPKWLLPVIRERLAEGGAVTMSAAIVASWARYDEGRDESGEEIVVVDRLKDRLMARAARQRSNLTEFIEDGEVFGDLADQPAFVEPYTRTLQSLFDKGSAATVRDLVR